MLDIRAFLYTGQTHPARRPKMNSRCFQCGLVNNTGVRTCLRCGAALNKTENIATKRGFHKSSIAKRAVVCVMVILVALVGFYASLVFSADPLSVSEQQQVLDAIRLLEQKGFTDDAFLLRRVAVFRRNDNWLNASVEKENAYAATNFPFEIVTLYPDFFIIPADDVERAAILLHEAKHLQGKDEKDAYDFVWRNRKQLGWIEDTYSGSVIWLETRKLTRDYSPILFVCNFNASSDCTAR